MSADYNENHHVVDTVLRPSTLLWVQLLFACLYTYKEDNLALMIASPFAESLTKSMVYSKKYMFSKELYKEILNFILL